MKKILIPILLSTSTIPFFSMVSCNKPSQQEGIVELTYTEKVSEQFDYPGFIYKKFKIIKNKQYWFSVDFNKLPDEVYDKQKNEGFGFLANDQQEQGVRPDYEKTVVMLNETPLERTEWGEGEGQAIRIWTPTNHWLHTDKFYFGVIWTKSTKANIYCLLNEAGA